MSDGPKPDYVGEILNMEREVLQLQTNLAASRHRRHRVELELAQMEEGDRATEQAIAAAQERIAELTALNKEINGG